MKIRGKHLKKLIRKTIRERENTLPIRVWGFLDTFQCNINESQDYEVMDILIKVVIESRDLGTLTAIGDLLSCLDWNSLEMADNDTISKIGTYISDTAKERHYHSLYCS